jgi:serine/threonine protein phosphatase PrpC
MLHYDYYYTIGVTHHVCEDYATQGDTPTPFIVLSDGCSGSENSDVGARILTLTTKYIIENASPWPLDYLSFGQRLISKALGIAEQLQLPSGALDATVMLAFLHQDSIMVYVYGDGCLLFKDHAGNLGTIEIAFTHNAPYYLTYWYDEQRWQEYARSEPKPLVLIDSVNGLSEPKPFQTQLAFCLPLKKFKVIAIASDGATRCINTRKSVKLPLYETATNLLAFQSLKDEFVKRHIKSTLEQYAVQGIYPADDLSIGVFCQ